MTHKSKKSLDTYVNVFQLNDSEGLTDQKLWDAAKALPKGNFQHCHVYIRTEERSKINNLASTLKS